MISRNVRVWHLFFLNNPVFLSQYSIDVLTCAEKIDQNIISRGSRKFEIRWLPIVLICCCCWTVRLRTKLSADLFSAWKTWWRVKRVFPDCIFNDVTCECSYRSLGYVSSSFTFLSFGIHQQNNTIFIWGVTYVQNLWLEIPNDYTNTTLPIRWHLLVGKARERNDEVLLRNFSFAIPADYCR